MPRLNGYHLGSSSSGLEQQKNQEKMTVMQLRDMDPWELEVLL
jgi:hypothetical protein